MKKIMYVVAVLIMAISSSCLKQSSVVSPSKASLLVCSKYDSSWGNSSWQLIDKNNNAIAINDNDSFGNYASIDSGKIRIKYQYFEKGSSSVNKHFDTIMNLKVGSVNTLFTV